jgi:hypothetical protein
MKNETIFVDWMDSLRLDYWELIEYLDTEQSYIDFAEYYCKQICGDGKIAIAFETLLDMIDFIAESTTDINEQFGGCTDLEKLIESNEMPELYYKLINLKDK